jgi:hypothetical protein
LQVFYIYAVKAKELQNLPSAAYIAQLNPS